MLRFTVSAPRAGLCVALALGLPSLARAGATLFAYGTAAGDTTMARSDDGFAQVSWTGTGPAGSTPVLPFYGKSYSSLFVNNNGNVSFGSAVWFYAPTAFSSTGGGFPAMIAPFWADVDTRLVASATEAFTPATRLTDPGSVYYRTTQDPTQLAAIGTKIRSSYLGTSSFAPTTAQIVTWDHVAGWGLADTNATNGALRNTFQLVLATDGFNSYSLFLYPDNGVQWLIGAASGDSSYPSVGFQDGAGNYYNAVGSRTASMANLPGLSAAVPASPGTQAYRIDDPHIVASPTIGSTDGVLAPPVVTHRWVSLTGSGNWAAGTTNWTGNSYDPAAIATDTTAATWANGHGAIFGGTAGTVSITAPISAKRITLETSGYTFTSTLAENSLQLAQLILPSASATVNFAGNLVVVVDRNLVATDINAGGVYLGAVTQGNLAFKNNSILVGRGTGALNGGTITLQSAAQFQLYGAAPTTRATALVFDRATAGGTGGTFDLRGYSTTIGALSSLGTASGIITNSGSTASTLTVDFDNASSTFNGVLQNGTGTLALTKTGTGSQILSGSNTYSAGTSVTGGLIKFATLANFGSGTITLNGGGLQWATGTTTDVSTRLAAIGVAGATLDTNGNTLALASVLTGTGGLTKTGAGALTLSAANSYTGNTTINGGTLIAARNGEIGTFQGGTTVTVNSAGTLVATLSDSLGWGGGNAHLVLNGGTVTTDTSTGQHTTLQNVTMTGGLLTSAATDGRFLLNGPLATNASSSIAIINAPYLDLLPGWTNGVTTSFTVAPGSTVNGIDLDIASAVIGSGPFIKNGTGTLRLTGTNTYSGATSINAGTLLVNSSLANSTVTVAAGATLAGSSTIGRAVTLAGTVAPSGTLTPASLTWQAGGRLATRLGTTPDVLAVTGALTRSGTGSYTIAASAGTGFTPGTYTVATFGSTTFRGSDLSLELPSGYVGSVAVTSSAIQVTVNTVFGAWAADNALPTGQQGVAHDPDGDGVVNALEFALGLNPTTPGGTLSTATTVSVGGVPYPAIRFNRRRALGDITVTVQAAVSPAFASDLGTVEVSATDLGNGLDEVVVRSAVPLSTQPTQFLRVLATSL